MLVFAFTLVFHPRSPALNRPRTQTLPLRRVWAAITVPLYSELLRIIPEVSGMGSGPRASPAPTGPDCPDSFDLLSNYLPAGRYCRFGVLYQPEERLRFLSGVCDVVS